MNAHGTSVSLAVLLAVLASCGDSGRTCTLAGCSDGFAISVAASEPLRAGSYDIEVTMDGAPEACRIVLPSASPGADPVCSNRARLRASAVILNNGAPPDRTVPNAFSVDMLVAADVAVLKVQHDGVTLFEQTYRPTYQTVVPNGPECGPICEWAPSERVTLTYD